MADIKLRYLLITMALLFGYLFSDDVVQSARNRSPVEISYEQLYANGSDAEWLIVRDAWVDQAHKIETERGGSYAGTFLPLRAGPDDTRPVKYYTTYRRAGADGPDDTIRGVVDHDEEAANVVKGVVLLRDEEPAGGAAVAGMVLMPAALLGAGLLLVVREKRKAA